MSQTNIVFSSSLTSSNPSTDHVLIIGPLSIIQSSGYESVKCKIETRVNEDVWKTGVAGLSEGDSVPLYLNNVVVASLPTMCSRHNTPSQAHAITKFVKMFSSSEKLFIVIVCEAEMAFASACAVARAFPRYSRKLRNMKTKKFVTVEFILSNGIKLTDVDIKCMTEVTEGIRLAQEIVDKPCEEMHTDAFVKLAEVVAEDLGVQCNVIKGEELLALGFGCIHSVGRAAVHEPAMVILSHEVPNGKQKIAWVGKGIVFDSGGLCIKTKATMLGMKRDCGGAAAILGAFYAAVKSGFDQNLYAVLCLAENAVSGNSIRVDDIITSYSGKTIEINNTDAEGRLVLADGVSYARKDLKCDIILDMATLTGAQGIATGQIHGAVCTNSEEWEKRAFFSGRYCGDLVFPVPFLPEFHIQEFSSVFADMKNSVADRSNAQVSCAGTFIFANLGFNYPGAWIHVDMASPVHQGERATGYGVALLCSLFGHCSSAPLLKLGSSTLA